MTDEEIKDFQERSASFDSELSQLIEKYNIIIVPKILYTEGGIIPQLKYLDKRQFEEQTGSGSAARSVQGQVLKG